MSAAKMKAQAATGAFDAHCEAACSASGMPAELASEMKAYGAGGLQLFLLIAQLIVQYGPKVLEFIEQIRKAFQEGKPWSPPAA